MKTTLALAAALLVALPVMAQQKAPNSTALPDWRAEPRYATLNLRAGFEPDPRQVPVEAGGDREATAIRPDCVGWIDFARPDVDLNYEAGQFPLIIGAASDADVTLVVNDPSGRWHCNDDFQGTNPGVVFQRPESGNYNIWVGTFERGAPRRALVIVTEVPPQARR